jgi:hypothetical protein
MNFIGSPGHGFAGAVVPDAGFVLPLAPLELPLLHAVPNTASTTIKHKLVRTLQVRRFMTSPRWSR